jgi:hypothetical protein
MKTGEIPGEGLCSCFSENTKIELFSPTNDDYATLMREGEATTFWGFGGSWRYSNSYDRRKLYTPMRQTVVLLMAAINNEL